jgi:hypothetical protein
MIQEGIALPASSLALPGTTRVTPGKQLCRERPGLLQGSTVALPAQNGDDLGNIIADKAIVEPR